MYDFSTGLSLSTTLYGFYSPIKPLRNALGIGDIRHVFKPSISFTYTPDFSDPQWNLYKTYTQEIVDASTGVVSFNDIKYSFSFVLLYMATIYGGLNEEFDIRKIAAMMVALVFIIVGNYLPKKVQADRNPMNKKWAYLFILLGFLTFTASIFYL